MGMPGSSRCPVATDAAWLMAIRERDSLARAMFVDELSTSAKDRQRLLDLVDDVAEIIHDGLDEGEPVDLDALLDTLGGHGD